MLAGILKQYLKLFPEETPDLTLLQAQIKDNEKLNDRRNFRGHITGSGIVLSPDKTKILLIHHKFFNLWQQPGGHWEADEKNPLAAAKRETEEETSVHAKEILSVDPKHPLVPLDIDTHQVPARPNKNEPPHFHHDFRYLFVAADETLVPQELEVSGAQWFLLDDPAVVRIAPCIEKIHRFKFV